LVDGWTCWRVRRGRLAAWPPRMAGSSSRSARPGHALPRGIRRVRRAAPSRQPPLPVPLPPVARAYGVRTPYARATETRPCVGRAARVRRQAQEPRIPAVNGPRRAAPLSALQLSFVRRSTVVAAGGGSVPLPPCGAVRGGGLWGRPCARVLPGRRTGTRATGPRPAGVAASSALLCSALPRHMDRRPPLVRLGV
jgi:hypothetical protein